MTASVAIITNYGPSVVRFRGALIRALTARGIAVMALAPDYDDRTRAQVRELGARPVDYSLDRVGLNPLRDLADVVRLARLLRVLRPDATLSAFVKPVVYGTIAAALARVKRRYAMIEGLGYLFTVQDRETVRRRALRALLSVLLRVACGLADRVFFLNEDDRGMFVRRRLAASAKTRNIGAIGVDLAAFPETPVPAGDPSFLFIGRLLKEKGAREFVAAARLLRSRGVSARFVMLGGLDANPGSVGAEEAAQWAADGIVEWPGQVDDVPGWIARSTVFVLPSYREGMPRSTQEAMAMGRAVVTTDAPGCRDTVIEGRNGFKVPIMDAAALAAAMERFVDDPALAAAMGRESRRIAEERFDVDKINAVILAEMGIVDG